MTFLKRQKYRDLTLDLLFDLIGSFFYALSIYTFASQANFAPGGISGLALIVNYLWGLPIGLISLVFNIPLILFSCRIIGKQFLFKTLRTMLINTIFLDLIFPLTPCYTGDPLLAALFSGVCLGAALALVYMRGSSTGGTDFLTMSVKALKPHLSIGGVTMTIDLIVILLGWPVFGNLEAVLYGLISTFVCSTVIDKLMYGAGAGKLVIIITSDSAGIAARISEVCERGSTAIRAKGTYTGIDRDVLLCACRKAEAYKVRNAAHQVDRNSFVMITETSEVFGEGFINPDEK